MFKFPIRTKYPNFLSSRLVNFQILLNFRSSIFPIFKFSIFSSTLQFVAIRAFSRAYVWNDENRNWHWENRKRGIGSKVEIALDASARGCFIRRATGAGCRRDENGYRTTFPPPFLCPFSLSRSLAFLSRLLLISSDPTYVSRASFSFLFIFWFPSFRSGSSIFMFVWKGRFAVFEDEAFREL